MCTGRNYQVLSLRRSDTLRSTINSYLRLIPSVEGKLPAYCFMDDSFFCREKIEKKIENKADAKIIFLFAENFLQYI